MGSSGTIKGMGWGRWRKDRRSWLWGIGWMASMLGRPLERRVKPLKKRNSRRMLQKAKPRFMATMIRNSVIILTERHHVCYYGALTSFHNNICMQSLLNKSTTYFLSFKTKLLQKITLFRSWTQRTPPHWPSHPCPHQLFPSFSVSILHSRQSQVL